MSKAFNFFFAILLIGLIAIGVTNLIFTIIIHNDQNKAPDTGSDNNPVTTLSPGIKTAVTKSSNTKITQLVPKVSTKSLPQGQTLPIQTGSTPSKPPVPLNGTTSGPLKPNSSPSPGHVSTSPGFKAAADQLLRGLDFTVDPCDDFYQYTCNNYLKNVQFPPGSTRIGTYDEAQEKVFDEISRSLDVMDLSIASTTEKITKNIYSRCLDNIYSTQLDKSQAIYAQIVADLHDVPMFAGATWVPINVSESLKVVGNWERQWGISTLFSGAVTADDGNPTKPALYFSKPPIPLPLDYFIRPQFLAELERYRKACVDLFTLFANNLNKDASRIDEEVTKVVQFQVQLAMNFVPNDLLKNAKLQYNNYTLADFAAAYPSIGREYFENLLTGVLPAASIATVDFVITEPRYFRAVDGILQDSGFDTRVLANFLSLQFLLNNQDFVGGDLRLAIRQITNTEFKPRKKDYDEGKLACVSVAQDLMPYGTGYIYIKNMKKKEREAIVADVSKQVDLVIQEFLKNVDQLSWMTFNSKKAVHDKADNVVRNIAYPYWFNFTDTTDVDAYHINYVGLDAETDYFTLLNRLATAQQLTENLGLLAKPTLDRRNFQDSPATVNAWYAPELNSITIPRAILNEPYYRLDFPQAYNFAGNGGSVGHELTHGFDNDGSQYGPNGELANCGYQFCTILDANSTTGFLDMAQCVISQFNEQCCPLKSGNVHCANGVNTQGENIADIGGQYAAYNAYRRYVKEERNGVEEDLLPGLEQFTPNQVFWITYGFSWCMKQTDENLARQLLTNEHAPGSCRVNQVLQDLPEFAKDFGCKPRAKMFPDQKCSVWR